MRGYRQEQETHGYQNRQTDRVWLKNTGSWGLIDNWNTGVEEKWQEKDKGRKWKAKHDTSAELQNENRKYYTTNSNHNNLSVDIFVSNKDGLGPTNDY